MTMKSICIPVIMNIHKSGKVTDGGDRKRPRRITGPFLFLVSTILNHFIGRQVETTTTDNIVLCRINQHEVAKVVETMILSRLYGPKSDTLCCPARPRFKRSILLICLHGLPHSKLIKKNEARIRTHRARTPRLDHAVPFRDQSPLRAIASVLFNYNTSRPRLVPIVIWAVKQDMVKNNERENG